MYTASRSDDKSAAADALTFRTAPHNIEAEQALLGAILVNNEAHDRVSAFLEPEHFFDPLHQQIYETAAKLITSGKQATPITLRTFFEKSEPIDPGLTVPQYLGRLAANACTIINARDYGQTIHDLATRRQLILIGEDMVDVAFDSPVDFDPGGQIAQTQKRLDGLSAGNAETFAAVPLDEFLERKFPERKQVVKDLLNERSIAMIYGWRGRGKSWFAMSLALAIAKGGPFLKWEAGSAHGVLYVDGEMPAVAMQERLRGLTAGEAPPEKLRLLSADMYEHGLPDLAITTGQAAIERVLGALDVMILDNVSTLFRTGVENEAESWLPVQQWLLRLRRRGKTVILIHHAGKGKEQRGTSRREDVLDLVLNLRAPDDYNQDEGARFDVRFEKARGLTGGATDTFEAKLGSGPHGELVWTWQKLEDAKLAEILELKEEGKSLRAIGKELGMSKSAVQRALAKCPAVPPSSERDSGTAGAKVGQWAGLWSGQSKANAYAAAKSGDD